MCNYTPAEIEALNAANLLTGKTMLWGDETITILGFSLDAQGAWLTYGVAYSTDFEGNVILFPVIHVFDSKNAAKDVMSFSIPSMG